MKIQKLHKSEKPNALNLAWSVFLEFEAPDYSQKGIDTFRNFLDNEDEINKLDMVGAYEEGKLIGLIATRNSAGHIALFFVHKDYHRQGIGRKLFEEILKGNNSKEITVNSSPYAVEIYRRLGFVETDKEQTKNGLRYIPMKFIKEEI